MTVCGIFNLNFDLKFNFLGKVGMLLREENCHSQDYIELIYYVLFNLGHSKVGGFSFRVAIFFYFLIMHTVSRKSYHVRTPLRKLAYDTL